MKTLKDSIADGLVKESFRMPKTAQSRAKNQCRLDGVDSDWSEAFVEYARKNYKKLKNANQISSSYPRVCAIGVSRFGNAPVWRQEPEAQFYINNEGDGTPVNSTVVSLGLRGGFATVSYHANIMDCLEEGEVYEVPEKDYAQFCKLFSAIPELS